MKMLSLDNGPPPVRKFAPPPNPTGVLVVHEDEDDLREMSGLLVAQGYPTVAARSAADALARLAADDAIGIVVTDAQLSPEGAELVERIRRDFADRTWLQLIVIAGRRSADSAAALRHAANDFLRKPVGREELLATVARAADRVAHARRMVGPAAMSAEQLQALCAEAARFVDVLHQLRTTSPPANGHPAGTPPDSRSPAGRAAPEEPSALDAATLRRVIQARSLRARIFGNDLFADPAWDILLDLMRARLSGQAVSVMSLCIAAGVPTTTALRRIDELIQAGYVRRHQDPVDRRRKLVEITDKAADKLERYFRAIRGSIPL